jgi:RNA polymerase sigma factor (TIGR02999 family)
LSPARENDSLTRHRPQGAEETDVAARLSELVERADGGDAAAVEILFTTLYSELHRLADRQLARNGSGVALDTTSLLHEAYLDMAGREGATFPDRARFFGYAARVMRNLIVDRARRGLAQKRGGHFEITALEGEGAPASAGSPGSDQIVRLHDALGELATVEPELAQVVDLKYFCGFSFAEIAALHGVAERTVQRRWSKARLFLHRSLGEGAV